MNRCPKCGKSTCRDADHWGVEYAWLRDNDLEVIYDFSPRRGPNDAEKEAWAKKMHKKKWETLTEDQRDFFYYEWDRENSKDSYYIQTLEDRSVGIFGYTLSPVFDSKEDLKEWIRTIMELRRE